MNLRAPSDRPQARRLPPAVVTQPAESPRSSDTGMLATDSAYFRAHPLMVPVEGVVPAELRDTFHEARSGGRMHMAT
ncbi:MAG TPA: hypothetical protein VJS39_05310, partial [Gemmatimonadaceae bacterium]|nr:hypothetical protein [Gemmatimonadaceae bacterium]